MFFWISCAAAGVSLCLVVWVFTRPVVAQDTDIPRPSHGVLFKLAWPWISVLSRLCGPFISWPMREALGRRIQIAGLASAWHADHVVALQCLVFFLTVLAPTAFLLSALDMPAMQSLLLAVVAGLFLMWWPRLWLRDMGQRRQNLMLREFPFLLDMTTLCVEAGLNLQGALQQAASHGPDGPLRSELRHALADMRAGMPRLQALDELAGRTGLSAVRSLVTALMQADQLGMSLGPLLRSQSDQRRAERFLRAEKLALEAPVKMLFPMVLCIFPCTFLVIGFPIAIKIMGTEF
ncbi:hypothetical protein CR159_12810 [Pollutimonas subterranea]|uniref:Type II secretion system protein GspF domain-containing protein n=1 Tax=Pollutimonas subterranea TaxID=2045210 RepID=A0A2N4U382_9BURK|nr:type II secretion system F family protein [Pollutimonas subterranea]PLC49478.1 hypothetical protein CR159_12810 [Pollutimonas subterranea]